jgi:hypothetical protein
MTLDFIFNKDIRYNDNKRGWGRLDSTDCRHNILAITIESSHIIYWCSHADNTDL